jgi:hypothetical protein
MRELVKTLAAAAMTLAFLAGPAMANQCPLLIKQLKDAIAKIPAGDAKAKQALALVDEAQKLHDTSAHAKSVEKADQAAKVLGVALTKK